MCGIFAMLNYRENIFHNYDHLYKEFIKGKNRGPEFSVLGKIYQQLYFGFHRLAINGLNAESNQPLHISKEEGDVILICNGEIYNYKELYTWMSVSPTTDSDCEVIGHLYLKYGIMQTLNMLDGVFSFVLLDMRTQQIFVARDPFGVRPLYHIQSKDLEKSMNRSVHQPLIGFASELKCLHDIGNFHYKIKQFTPGTFSAYSFGTTGLWQPVLESSPYFIPTFSYSSCSPPSYSKALLKEKYNQIASSLQAAVYKRCLCTERPIACLLSGGLDSSLITALVNKFYRENNLPNQLETYSIGLEGSEDLKYAKRVSEWLRTKHTEIILTEQEMFDAIPEVIYAIESYDTTTVRASIGNYLLGKYIAANSDAKVIFNGDGSDELFGGYLYMHKCPDMIEFDKETRRLLKDIHLFDVLRSDKSISSHGLEPRTPFLDKSFVQTVLSLPLWMRMNSFYNKMEKFILRQSFACTTLDFGAGEKDAQLLSDEILWRKKEAFSDGVTSKGRSLYTIIQEKISEQIVSPDGSKFPINIETEKFYYKEIFLKHYANCLDIVPYYWMPKYTDANDPSARTLGHYNA